MFRFLRHFTDCTNSLCNVQKQQKSQYYFSPQVCVQPTLAPHQLHVYSVLFTDDIYIDCTNSLCNTKHSQFLTPGLSDHTYMYMVYISICSLHQLLICSVLFMSFCTNSLRNMQTKRSRIKFLEFSPQVCVRPDLVPLPLLQNRDPPHCYSGPRHGN